VGTDQAGASLRGVAATLLEMGCTRLELGATELAEARWRLAQQALAATVALFFLGVGLVLGVVALAWWVGPGEAALVLAIGAGLALALALLAIARWQQVLREGTPLLHDTLAQLRADARALQRNAAP
jgi:uncharacterized membrane protein YqjE